MALEQWEVELRQQLQDSSYNAKPKEKTWEDKLREQISNVQAAPPPRHHHHAPKKNNSALFVLIIVALLGAVLFAVNMKTGAITNWIKGGRTTHVEAPPANNPFDEKTAPPVVNGTAAEIRQLRQDVDKMKADNATKFQDVEKRLKWNGDRISLLGMMHNENWLVIRNQGSNSSQFLYFNGDWTLSGMPQYLQLTDEDRAFLQKYQKKD